MSNRFIGFNLTILAISNIFFFNLALEIQPLTYQDIVLGKILNQSNRLLIFLYIITNNKFTFKEINISIILLIIIVGFSNEVFNYFYIQEDKILENSIFMIIEKLLWILIFISLGGRLFTKNHIKSFLNLIFGFSLLYFSYKAIQSNTELKAIPFLNFTMLIIIAFVIFSSNIRESYFHMLGIGALLITFGDLAFIYSGYFEDLHWRSLYLLPRFLISIGELMIIYKILENYNSENFV
ncbi:hypothetical protein EGI22_07725 [Lacihabitans sp. LS3-19]|uniref:hypothetical protein n=1 Tax=Lacihabitans sp. LS3-19 TaxID=2487335 RepID=UPI0020CD1AC7|nr:hypothetical protein [Lacihabitans sp. LS3-19]MCP9767799.1 hypothetical protein [Lacihabitans sp. LS3-19]